MLFCWFYSWTKGCDKFLETVRTRFDTYFDKFEMYALKNIFHIPETVMLEGEEIGGDGSGPLLACDNPDAVGFVSLAELEAEENRLDAEIESTLSLINQVCLCCIASGHRRWIRRSKKSLNLIFVDAV